MENRYWFAVVEENNDPEKRGRIRIRILGIHNEETNEFSLGEPLQKEELPYAVPIMPMIYGGTPASTVPVTSVLPGAVVFGFSTDAHYMNNFVIGIVSLFFNEYSKGDGNSPIAGSTEAPTAEEEQSCFEKNYNSAEEARKAVDGENGQSPGENMQAFLKYLQQNDSAKFTKLCDSMGIEVDANNLPDGTGATVAADEAKNKIFSEFYYKYTMSRYQNDTFFASMAYYAGVQYADEKYAALKGSTNEEIMANLEKDTNKANVAKYMQKYMENQDEKCNPNTRDLPEGDGQYHLPTEAQGDGYIMTSAYREKRTSEKYGKNYVHKGIDLRARKGVSIVSCYDGTVTQMTEDYNKIVIKQKDGYTLTYLHCDTVNVKVGQEVKGGDQIGTAGGKAKKNADFEYPSHLHLEVNGGSQNPRLYLDKVLQGKVTLKFVNSALAARENEG